jgi:hypothetical protein
MEKPIKTISPVLLIIFNRPDTTQKVFNEIRKAKPDKLYISADGPRPGNIDDEVECKLAREIIKQVDWPCQLHIRLLEKNLGCGPGPVSAISWVFENEDSAIILEDDFVPAQPFFSYCDELLERYKNDTRIWIISGDQYNEEAVKTPHSYFFSRYGHGQGWATWKRCWISMDMSLSKYPLIIAQDLYKAAFRTDKETAFFQKKIERIYHDDALKSHMWDFQFGFAITSNGGLSIVPKKNLVTNIGYLGTHSKTKNQFHDRPVDENFKIISHPDFILCDVNYDTWHFKHYWNKKTSILKRLMRKIHKIVKGKIKQ